MSGDDNLHGDPEFFHEHLRDEAPPKHDKPNGHDKGSGHGNGRADGSMNDTHGAKNRASKKPDTKPPEVLDMGLDTEPPAPREWLLGHTFARHFLSGLIGTGGAAKTTIRILQLLAVATGRGDLVGERVYKRARVLIVCLEDDAREIRRRVRAAWMHHKIPQSELVGWFFVWSTKRDKFLEVTPRGGAEPGTLCDRLRWIIDNHSIDIVCIDPFVKSHTANENDNSLIDEVANQFIELSYEKNCAPDYTHHVRKGSRDAAGDPEAGRGASALPFTTRLLYTAAKMTAEEAKLFSIEDKDRKLYTRVDDAKVNIAPPAERARWFKLVSVNIGNDTEDYPEGDFVQTVKLWEPTDPCKDLPKPHIAAVFELLRQGAEPGKHYSPSPASPDWAGVAVMTVTGKTDKQAAAILAAWLKSETLIKRGKVIILNERKAKEILGPLYQPPAPPEATTKTTDQAKQSKPAKKKKLPISARAKLALDVLHNILGEEKDNSVSIEEWEAAAIKSGFAALYRANPSKNFNDAMKELVKNSLVVPRDDTVSLHATAGRWMYDPEALGGESWRAD